MSDESTRKPLSENPVKYTGLSISQVKETAGGIPAVLSAFRHILAETGWVRGWKALAQLNQKRGYDCPGCAWPDPDDERSGLAEYCENGAKAVAEEATNKKIGPDFFLQNSVYELSLLSDFEIGKKGRIESPLYLPAGATHYRAITWSDAFEKIATYLKELSHPDQAIFYTSGRTSNEAAFLYQLFVRSFGTNNLPDCSNMCHESSGVALGESLGIGKGSVTLDDFNQAEVILILGQNPGTNHPRMLTALQKAKRNGAIIVSINPLREAGLIGFDNPQQIRGMLHMDPALSDLFLQVKINGDLPLLQAINYLLLQEEEMAPGTILDIAFIEKNTIEFRQYVRHIKALDFSVLAKQAGIGEEEILALVRLIRHKKRIIACWAMGLTQHKNAVDTIKEIVNLLLLKGSIGVPGGGTCPVRGHSNVQGDRTMGIYEKPSKDLLEALREQFHFDPPAKHGYDVVDSIRALHNGSATFFMAMGGNFLSATPDTAFTSEALRKCGMTVHITTKLNRSHLVHGKESIILPCLARSDKDMQNGVSQFVSCENSMGVVQSSMGNLAPVSDQLLSEPAIVCKMAKAYFGTTGTINWDGFLQHYDYIREAIEKTIPGFDGYNQKVRKPGGFYLPNANREGRFETFSSKAQFNIADYQPQILSDHELLMMTIRSHDQFNTTIYGLDDRYRGIKGERRVIFMNAEDMAALGLEPKSVVNIYNFEGGKERVAKGFIAIPYNIPRKCTATYFPETNVLVPLGIVADKSKTPVSKGVVIEVRK
ncbi:FdhF/YdeP family oxidoreductase [Flavihumibacter fluvii]|uniref:FdhF/YdeP family oxidoreductase n=1 Tax=Flavihumibacter fluvii TaxID=2838157 RepID=UPI001BDE1CBE|nr:FdhF/YdeP family oxidoreductase [Flavihumibacter fluvii]ULQ53462.1 FdhF/YdeP family oxidoreductase [Flavihumibacter fluvii]